MNGVHLSVRCLFTPMCFRIFQRRHAVEVLEAIGKVLMGTETYRIGNLCDRDFFTFQHTGSMFQADIAQINAG